MHMYVNFPLRRKPVNDGKANLMNMYCLCYVSHADSIFQENFITKSNNNAKLFLIFT